MKYVAKACYYLLLLMIGAGVVFYVMDPQAAAMNYTNLGFPAWVMVFNGIAKALGIVLLLIPQTPQWIKTSILAGFFYILSLALVAHLVLQDGEFMGSLVGLVLLLVHVGYTRCGSVCKES